MTRHRISDPLPLTARQARIIADIAMGRLQKQIAADLEISVNTVNRHVENIKIAIGAKTLAHAAALWASGKIQVRQP